MQKLTTEKMTLLNKKIAEVEEHKTKKRKSCEEIDFKVMIANKSINQHSVEEAVLKVVNGEYTADILFQLIENGWNFSHTLEYLILSQVALGNLPLDILYNYQRSLSFFSEDMDKLIIKETIKGNLPDKFLRGLLQQEYGFSDVCWEMLFASGIDFMVDAYMKEKYPDIEY